MARRSRSQDGSSTVLVIFLVFFILSNISFGVWIYTLFQDRDKWDKVAKDKEEELKAQRQAVEWYKYQRDELLAAIGEPDFNSKSEVIKAWRENRDFFLNKEKFKGEEGAETFRTIIKDFLEPKLGGFTDDNYKAKFVDLPTGPKTKLEEMQPKYAKEVLDNSALVAKFKNLEKKYNDDRLMLLATIQTGNKEAYEVRTKQSEAMTEALKQNEELRKDVDKLAEKFKKELDEKDKALRVLSDKFKAQEVVAKNPNRALMEPHALVLDLSRGKPLWDVPRAKVIRIDDSSRKLYIDKGSADGVKTGLTFMAFAAGWNGRGEGALKAIVEVVGVEGEHISQCKITSFYDNDGHELAVTDATPAKILRDGASALKEGDLLFNLFWGTHVAIAGVIDFTGFGAPSPAAQMDNLRDFMRHLERTGIVIDAYCDLRDGKMVGEPSTKTNFVIRGAPASVAPGAEKDERVTAINNNIKAMREQAIDRGLFIVSADNFAIVTGYRRPGSADNQPTLTFVPRRPAGAAGLQGDLNQQQQTPPAEKK
jgi:hypothetical protein